MPPTPAIPAATRAAIEECWRCHAACMETVRHCLAGGGGPATSARIVTLLDCADMCRTAADTMSRGSPHFRVACAACAELCRAAAAECRAVPDDERMQACAEACDRCARSCGVMAG